MSVHEWFISILATLVSLGSLGVLLGLIAFSFPGYRDLSHLQENFLQTWYRRFKKSQAKKNKK